jgi:CoA-transferase family III
MDAETTTVTAMLYAIVKSCTFQPAMTIPPPNVVTGPLAGMRVIELGMLIAGPFAGRMLADLGA